LTSIIALSREEFSSAIERSQLNVDPVLPSRQIRALADSALNPYYQRVGWRDATARATVKRNDKHSPSRQVKPMTRYLVEIFCSDEDDGYIANIPDLPGCSAWGRTRQEAAKEIEAA
jgi:hypothetical protein